MKTIDLEWTGDCYGANGACLAELFKLTTTAIASTSLHDTKLSSQLVSGLNSVLLYGPSGIGKSHLIQRLASQFSVHMVVVDAAILTIKSPGAIHSGLRAALDEAIQHQPAVIVLDRIETLFPSGEERTPLAYYFVDLLDEISEQRPSVLVIGVTCHRNRVDPLVIESFMDHIELKQPDQQQKRALFTECTSHLAITNDLIDTIVGRLHGYLAADIKALCVKSEETALIRGANYDDQRRLQLIEADFTTNQCTIIPSITQLVSADEKSEVVRWSDIGGLEEVKQLLQESVVWTREHVDIYRNMGVRPSCGILLYGPPGTGKTLLAKAVATESDSRFMSISIPELIRSHIGESEKALCRVFQRARQSAPCVVFLDELEAIFGSRDSSGDVGHQLITQLMLEIDQLHDEFMDTSHYSVVLLAATNHPEMIDPAILRSGRLDRLVYVPPPSLVDRRNILAIHMERTPFSKSLCNQLRNSTSLLDGYTGADITAVVRMAALHAIGRTSTQATTAACLIEEQDWQHALSTVQPSVTSQDLIRFTDFRNNKQ
ncbi:P-loop containing nucleoside triphosphate hydrolase protein [Syncephalis plumigaleata]|nr:P-loop containing nucleoside triphosphate hydrolase protein [Syncephalis plumigaleata]